MKQVTGKQQYVTGGTTVLLSIQFGNGQMGMSRLKVDDELLSIGSFSSFPLQNMSGKTLLIKSTVTDVNDQTDNVNATYLLSGGPQALEFGLDAVAEANGKSVDFNVEVKFT